MKNQSGKLSFDRYLVGDGGKRFFLFIFGGFLCAVGIFSDPLPEILLGVKLIIIEPDYLISDYFQIGGRGASFVNSGMLTLLFTAILAYYKIRIRGISIAAVFTVAGFAFFGKNLFNVWFILGGVWLYAWYHKESFLNFIYIAFFGTALSPIVSQLMFGLYLPEPLRVVVGAITGLSAGFILPSLATSSLSMHKGYNLYNVGFTAGIVGTLYVSLFRSHGFVAEARVIWSTGNNGLLLPMLLGMFLTMILAGFLLNGRSFNGLLSIWASPGRLLADFVDIFDFPPTLINMGVNGLLATVYLLIIGGDFNGPTIGGIFTIVGFSAMGKTPRNITPIIAGVVLGSLTKQWNLAAPEIQLTALFGTTLAPIAGEFGWKAGILAGYVHSSVVMYVGVLHAGFNLYNNGFAGGLVASMLVPLVKAFRGRGTK